MKTTQLVFAVVTTLALTLSAVAQTEEPQTSNALSSDVAKARCAYAPAEDACAVVNDAHPSADAPRLLAQLPRRVPGRYPAPRRRPMAYPYPAYPPTPTVSGRHAAIGAAIGFTIGVVAGSRTGAKDAVGLGLFTAGLGAVMGLVVPAFPQRHYYPYPDDDDDDALRQNLRRAKSRTARLDDPKPDASRTDFAENGHPDERSTRF